MSKGTNQHVTPHKGGGWQVKGAGSKKARDHSKSCVNLQSSVE